MVLAVSKVGDEIALWEVHTYEAVDRDVRVNIVLERKTLSQCGCIPTIYRHVVT